MSATYRLTKNADLRAFNTFGVAARAERLVELDNTSALGDVLRTLAPHAAPFVLGGGSNVLLVDDVPGLVLRLTGHRITEVRRTADEAIVRADAGVNWHALVMHTLAQGLCGLENLALIPGTVGASPIQNIGAYGVEVRELVHAVEAYEPATGTLHRSDAADCGFAYRDSRFKREPDRYIVTAVEFRLTTSPHLRLSYAGLGEELAARGVATPGAQDVADAVIAIRRRKLPDPAVLGNAGSFFKNPIVPRAQAEALAADHPRLPVFGAGDEAHCKLSAAWLIDSAGWKGHRDGDAGIAASHALVLVNHGNASGAQLLDLARRVADSVQLRYGVALEPEPRIIGAQWAPRP